MSIAKNYFRLMAEDKTVGASSLFWRPLVTGASFVYGLGVTVLEGLYRKGVLPRKRLPYPVISVGNLTWGGTGKTPLVEYLARRVIERGKTPLILSRGYSQDEIEQLRHHLPRARVGVGRRRDKAAQAVDPRDRIHVAILDDGFQHWPLIRDVEILTVNVLNPFGNGKLVPRGILREPKRSLRRANVIVLTHVNLIEAKALENLRGEIHSLAPNATVVESFLEPLFFYRARRRGRLPLERLSQRRVATFSALANPRSFQLVLSRLGIRPVRNFEFGDHHVFTREELEEIRQVGTAGGVEEIVTTEKDFYRSPKLIEEVLNPLVMAARLRVSSGEEILKDRIFQLLGIR